MTKRNEEIKKDIGKCFDEIEKIQRNQLTYSAQTKRMTMIGLLLTVLINFLWQGLEYLFYGVVTTSSEDTIISFILIFSIFYNVKYYYRYRYDYKPSILISLKFIEIMQLMDSIQNESEDVKNEDN